MEALRQRALELIERTQKRTRPHDDGSAELAHRAKAQRAVAGPVISPFPSHMPCEQLMGYVEGLRNALDFPGRAAIVLAQRFLRDDCMNGGPSNLVRLQFASAPILLESFSKPKAPSPAMRWCRRVGLLGWSSVYSRTVNSTGKGSLSISSTLRAHPACRWCCTCTKWRSYRWTSVWRRCGCGSRTSRLMPPCLGTATRHRSCAARTTTIPLLDDWCASCLR